MTRRTAIIGLSGSLLVLLVAVVAVLLATRGPSSPDVGLVPTSQPPVSAPPTVPSDAGVSAAFADVGTSSARVEDVFVPEPKPVSLVVGDIDLAAPVVEVGIDPSGLMEVPAGDEIGWYHNGPRPGEHGSSVLAAHVDFDGRPGVFASLSQIEPGAVVAVGFDDGTIEYFETVGRRQYGKAELPVDEIFATDGTVPLLTLITCGGTFDASSESYDDNLVAYAVPLEA